MVRASLGRVLRRTSESLRLKDRRVRRKAVTFRIDPPEPPYDDGSAGVREPRRPLPNPPSLAMAAPIPVG